jgi:hypothetical protein
MCATSMLKQASITCAVSVPSIMQHTFYFIGHQTYIQLTKMSVKMPLIYRYCMSSYIFRPHRAIFRQHILMASTALCLLLSVVLVDVCRHYS